MIMRRRRRRGILEGQHFRCGDEIDHNDDYVYGGDHDEVVMMI